jgi:hypothetical protein
MRESRLAGGTAVLSGLLAAGLLHAKPAATPALSVHSSE